MLTFCVACRPEYPARAIDTAVHAPTPPDLTLVHDLRRDLPHSAGRLGRDRPSTRRVPRHHAHRHAPTPSISLPRAEPAAGKHTPHALAVEREQRDRDGVHPLAGADAVAQGRLLRVARAQGEHIERPQGQVPTDDLEPHRRRRGPARPHG